MKPILFIDWSGTLCHDTYWKNAEPELLNQIQEYLFKTHEEIVLAWMNGKYSSEEITRLLSKEFSVDYDMLWNSFVADCKDMFIEEEVLEAILKLKETYTTVLMTDHMDALERFIVPAIGLDKYFDSIVNSFNEGISKNDEGGKSFQKALTKTSSSVGASILVDNSKTSCRVFENLGGTSLLVTQERPLSYWLGEVVNKK